MARKKALTPQTRLEGLAFLVGKFPRFTRIILAMTISFIFAAALWFPLSLIAESLWILSLGLWFVSYIIGWWALVGFGDEVEAWGIQPKTAWYAIFGLVSFMLLGLEVLFYLLWAFIL